MKVKITKQQIKNGTAEEMEHTSSKKEARKIAMDHLNERGDYYKKLKGAGLAESYAGGGLLQYENGGGINPNFFNPNAQSLGFNTQDYTRRGYSGGTPDAQNEWIKGQLTPENLKEWLDPESQLNKGVQWRQDAINEIKTKQPDLYNAVLDGSIAPDKLNELYTEGEVGPFQSLVADTLPQMSSGQAPQASSTSAGDFGLQSVPDRTVGQPTTTTGGLPEDPLKKFTTQSPEWLQYADMAGALTGFIPSPDVNQADPTTYNAGLLNPQLVDEQSVRANIDAASRANVGALSNVTGGSGAAQRANLLGQGANYMNATGNAFLQANAMNNQAIQGADQFNIANQAGIAGQNASTLNRFELENKQALNDKAQNDFSRQMNAVSNIAGQVGDIGRGNIMDNRLNTVYDYDTKGNYQWARRPEQANLLAGAPIAPFTVPQPSTNLMPFAYGGPISTKRSLK